MVSGVVSRHAFVCVGRGLQEELESLPLSSIGELQALTDSGLYHSLLTMSVKDRRSSSVFLFQCEELGVRRRDLLSFRPLWLTAVVNACVFPGRPQADFIRKDLSRALARRQKDTE